MARIHLSKATVTEREEQLVVEALRSGWVAPLGPMVDRFEAEIAERTGVAGALALSSGTAALHLALLHHGVGAGDVVVVPSMTFAATTNAIVYTGATPVFVDSQASDANVDVALMIEAVDALRAEGENVAAVVTVDLYGRAVDYSTLVPALAERGIPLVEDAAEALGATLDGEACGSFGSCAAISFNGNKIMTTSGGGMLLSNDTELLARARYLSTQARQPAPWYEHTEVGYNYRMSNLLAALGIGQLERLDAMIARRREIRDLYADAFAELDGVRLLGRSEGDDDSHDNCWLTGAIVEGREPGFIDHVVEGFNAADIEARHLWKPMHMQPMYASARTFGGDVAAGLFHSGLNLPSGVDLSDDDVARVIATFRELVAS
ncbi:aminotransferase class I/II-fold pyridoxal phosphate-dependent enzyme [Dermacoccus nishinomiyaensis]|uniref:aminotransferase class I/II-fold pyridoxal phosphate-dependent enzyme n=1 Tax=Dermacoccus nishinomiyaensis TaxID=1274 RepID=UPI00248DC8CC|nr:aminotransferase class I/II-fold pyridoxal phosphate-dependent enzyme [Dermacoccus nishinomiyaensis]